MTELASQSSGYGIVEEEPTELAGKNLITGVHLWASASAFFFIGFVFAYFYLRSLNNGGMWHPKHVAPSLVLGTAVTACISASAGVLRLALADQRANRRRQWRRKAAVALAFLVAAIGLQLAEWATQDFGPTQGGYASVYIGWTALLFLFVVGTAFWLETVLATAIRYRGFAVGQAPPPGHASGDPHRARHDVADPLGLLRPQLTAVSFYTAYLAVIALVTWIVLYLV